VNIGDLKPSLRFAIGMIIETRRGRQHGTECDPASVDAATLLRERADYPGRFHPDDRRFVARFVLVLFTAQRAVIGRGFVLGLCCSLIGATGRNFGGLVLSGGAAATAGWRGGGGGSATTGLAIAGDGATARADCFVPLRRGRGDDDGEADLRHQETEQRNADRDGAGNRGHELSQLSAHGIAAVVRWSSPSPGLDHVMELAPGRQASPLAGVQVRSCARRVIP
jgi:hypothetical protein